MLILSLYLVYLFLQPPRNSKAKKFNPSERKFKAASPKPLTSSSVVSHCPLVADTPTTKESPSSSNSSKQNTKPALSVSDSKYDSQKTSLLHETKIDKGNSVIEMFPPTKSGIHEIVKTLTLSSDSTNTCAFKRGLVAYPTESSYVLGCNAHATNHGDRSSSSSLLMNLMKKSSAEADILDQDRKFMFSMHLPSVNEARRHFTFEPCRKYAYRKRINGSASSRFDSTDSSGNSSVDACLSTTTNCNSSVNGDQQYKMVYCKLSEGREVFERLADAFWPGALTILARTTWKCIEAHQRELFHSDRSNDHKAATETYFVPIRCPSHPLAQCILREANVPVLAVIAAADKTSNHKPLLQALDVKKVYSPLLCEIIEKECEDDLLDADELLTDDLIDEDPSKPKRITQLAISNGEDKREIFTVSTCELAGECTMIKIDEVKSRVIILRDGVGPTKEQIARCLYRLPLNSDSTENISNSQLITTALLRKKWKVVVGNCKDIINDEENNVEVDGPKVKRQKTDNQ